MRNLAISIAIVMMSTVGAVHAADPDAGKAKSITCAACHGQTGISVQPIYPNLAGQQEQYLVASIKAYKSGDRKNPMMQPMVAALTDEDIANIAAYFASQACK
jgi:cytochrome c553